MFVTLAFGRLEPARSLGGPPMSLGTWPTRGDLRHCQVWYIRIHEQAPAVPEHALRRLLRARGAAAGRRAGARGAGHAVRRVPAAFLAARGVRARSERR